MGLKDKLRKNRAGRIKREPADAPQWQSDLEGEPLFVRGLTGTERDEYEASRLRVSFDPKGRAKRELDLTNLRARLVAKCLVDADGKRVYADAEVAELGQEPGDILDRLYEQALRLSGLSDEDNEALEKKFSETSGPASSAGSPDTSAGGPSAGDCGSSTPPS